MMRQHACPRMLLAGPGGPRSVPLTTRHTPVLRRPRRHTAACTAAAAGRAFGPRARHSARTAYSRLCRHASGFASGGASHGYGAAPCAHCAICACVLSARACVMASYAMTPSAQISWPGCTTISVLAHAAVAASSSGVHRNGSVRAGHVFMPAWCTCTWCRVTRTWPQTESIGQLLVAFYRCIKAVPHRLHAHSSQHPVQTGGVQHAPSLCSFSPCHAPLPAQHTPAAGLRLDTDNVSQCDFCQRQLSCKPPRLALRWADSP